MNSAWSYASIVAITAALSFFLPVGVCFGEACFRHELPFDRLSMIRWRQRIRAERLVTLLKGSTSRWRLAFAPAKPADFTKYVVDITVRTKAVASPTDALLMQGARSCST
jgi:transposase, IS5 family